MLPWRWQCVKLAARRVEPCSDAALFTSRVRSCGGVDQLQQMIEHHQSQEVIDKAKGMMVQHFGREEEEAEEEKTQQ